jgi:hypothetical protein
MAISSSNLPAKEEEISSCFYDDMHSSCSYYKDKTLYYLSEGYVSTYTFVRSLFLPQDFGSEITVGILQNPPKDFHQNVPQDQTENSPKDSSDCSICTVTLKEPSDITNISPFLSNLKSSFLFHRLFPQEISTQPHEILIAETSCCKNLFHKDCLAYWLRLRRASLDAEINCPCCRAPLKSGSIFSWEDKLIIHIQYTSSKMWDVTKKIENKVHPILVAIGIISLLLVIHKILGFIPSIESVKNYIRAL